MLTPRTLMVAGMVLLVATTLALGQSAPSQIYSDPAPPSEAVLRRLNLRLAWQQAVPVDGLRDGLLLVEVHGKDLFVLTRAGMLVRMDAETGVVYWRKLVDRPYTTLPFLTFNSRSVFVIANATLHSLERQRGTTLWQIPLSGGIAVAPVVDEERAFTSMADTRLNAYYLPRADGQEAEVRRIATSRGDRELIARPFLLWTNLTYLPLSFQPVLSASRLFTITQDGQGLCLSKRPTETGLPKEVFRFRTESRILLPPVGFGDSAYIGTNNGVLYSLDLETGKTDWRYMAGSAVTRRPVITDEDVYLTTQDEGLARIDRISGEPAWHIPQGETRVHGVVTADRFLAVNNRFVYATDSAERLLVIDRKRGRILSEYDASRFRFPVVNAVTDRLYLAANNGLILCLHDRDQPEPILHRKGLSKFVLNRLKQTIIETNLLEISVANYLGQLSDKYALQFRIADDAFKAAKVPNPRQVIVNVEGGTRTIRDSINRVLSRVPAHFDVVDETILILPGKGQPEKPEKPRPPAKKAPPKQEPEDPDK
jgi:outer membrane protein assembly factor BamB